jgi:uncharacterized membrane protein
MQALILLVLGFILWIFIWSIVSVVRVSSHSEALERLRRELGDLRSEIDRLRRELKEARSLPTPAQKPTEPLALEAAAPLTPPLSPVAAPVVAAPVQSVPAPAPVPLPVVSEPVVIAPPVLARETEQVPPPLPVTPPPVATAPVAAPEPSAPWINWELFMGVRLFAWLGGLAAFFGVALLVKLSFENNWFPPELRVALGFLTGVGLLIGGVRMSRKDYAVTSQTLCATGVLILYAVTFACHGIYHFAFFGAVPTFVLMILVTAVAFLLAVRLEAQVVALLGLLGGFLTPILLSTGQDNPGGLFGYIALLDAGLIAVALYRGWYYMIALAAAGTVCMQAGWELRFMESWKMPVACLVLCGFNLLFLGAAWLARRVEQAVDSVVAASGGLALCALMQCFVFLGIGGIEESPLPLFVTVLIADLVLLALTVALPKAARLHYLAGMIVFAWLGAWSLHHPQAGLLYWTLGSSLVLALLHTGFPLLMARLRPGEFPVSHTQYFAPVALALVLLPVLSLPEPPFALWCVLFLIDLVVIIVVALLGGMLALLAALLLSVFAVFLAISRVPFHAAVSAEGGFILLAALVAVVFSGAAWWFLRRSQGGDADGAGEDPFDAKLLPHLPALSALMPFTLLIMVVLRLHPAQPHAVFGLAFALSVLLLGFARIFGRGSLAPVSLLAIFALEWAWFASSANVDNAGATLCWLVGFYGLFLFPPFVLGEDFARRLGPWIAAAAAGPLQALLMHQFVSRYWPNDVMGLLPLAFAFPSLLGLLRVLRQLPEGAERRMDALSLFGGVTLLFITAVIPVQFDRQWITLGFALEGAALLWLFHRIPHQGLRLAGCGLLTAAFVRLALNPEILSYQVRGDTPVFNWYLYSYGLAIAALLVGARLLAPPRNEVLGREAPAWLNAFAGILGFFLLNLEIADYFGNPGTMLRLRVMECGFAQGMSYTIGWALYAFFLLVLGLWKDLRAVRRSAVVLLFVALLKLFLHDLLLLGQIYRVLAFIVVAVIASLASFLYQRFLRSDSDKPSP